MEIFYWPAYFVNLSLIQQRDWIQANLKKKKNSDFLIQEHLKFVSNTTLVLKEVKHFLTCEGTYCILCSEINRIIQ